VSDHEPSRGPELTDDALMGLYAGGDAEAFEALFARHHAGVYHFALAMLRDVSSAEDVLQETFLAVARTGRQYEPRGQFRTWLLRIVRNRCLNRLEARRVRSVVAGQAALDAAEPAAADPPPPRRAELDEDLAATRRALEALPPRQREAVVLYAMRQMPYRQIAEVLEVPVNTVKTLIHRARAALAVALDAAHKDHPHD